MNVPSSASSRLGERLFFLRSFLPVPVAALVFWDFYRTSLASPVDAATPWVAWVGIGVASLGQLLRYVTLGWVTEGTSGQGDRLEAKRLNTRGPYAHVRNPLYLGNWGIVLGLLLVLNTPLAWILVPLFFFGEYFFIIRAEETFLESRFGEAYRSWCRQVPRWIPRLTPASRGPLREGHFDYARALKKEHNPAMAWGSAVVVIFALRAWAVVPSTPTLVPFAVLEACLLAVYLGVKAWKHRWWKAALP